MTTTTTLLAAAALALLVVTSSAQAMDMDMDMDSNNNNMMNPLTSTTTTTTRSNIVVAMEEMKRANYFTFVTLLNMAPAAAADVIQGNVTFLMPKDRTLAKTVIPENEVVDFLLRHSIPSPLLFDHLQHIPTGSLLPTSRSELVVNVTNNGRKSFFLSNVQIVSPNICTRGSSIRCHGIDQVLQPSTMMAPSPPSCQNNTTTPLPPPPLLAPLPSPSPSPPPLSFNPNPVSTAAPPAADVSSQQKSDSQHMRHAGLLEMITYLTLTLLTLGLSIFRVS